MDLNLEYRWRFQEPGDTLSVHMENFNNSGKLFDATLTLQRRALNRSLLNRILFAYPPMTLKVILMIYWQALRLWNKNTPFYTHPKKRLEKRASP